MSSSSEYTQIVGASCGHCERRIVSLDDGAACPDCPTAVHIDDACWQAHWEAEHAGASTYRGATKAPPPVKELPPERVGQPVYVPAGTDGLLCTSCHHRVFAPVTMTFTGFPRFMCPDCMTTVLHPLGSGRKTFYFIAVGLSIVVTLVFLVQGQLAFPGILAIWAGVALAQNRGIQQKLERAEIAEPSMAEASMGEPLPRKKKKKKKAKPAEAA